MMFKGYRAFYVLVLLSGFMVLVGAERKNIALKKTTYQSGVITPYGHSALAVDGNTEGMFITGSCTHTDNSHRPWWEVDLGSTYDVKEAIVYNRVGCCQHRLSNYLMLGGLDCVDSNTSKCYKECYHHQTADFIQVLKLDNCTARYIRIASQLDEPLTICEIQIFGDLISDEYTSDTVDQSTLRKESLLMPSLNNDPLDDIAPLEDDLAISTASPDTLDQSTFREESSLMSSLNNDPLDDIVTQSSPLENNLAITASPDTLDQSTFREESLLMSSLNNEPLDDIVTPSSPLTIISLSTASSDTLDQIENNRTPNSWRTPVLESATKWPIDGSTEIMPHNSSMSNTVSPCLCYCHPLYPRTEETDSDVIEQFQSEIKANLTVAVDKLSSTRRKKTSAEDARPAAVFCGYFGIAIIVISLGGLVLPDIFSVLLYFYRYLKH